MDDGRCREAEHSLHSVLARGHVGLYCVAASNAAGTGFVIPALPCGAAHKTEGGTAHCSYYTAYRAMAEPSSEPDTSQKEKNMQDPREPLPGGRKPIETRIIRGTKREVAAFVDAL